MKRLLLVLMAVLCVGVAGCLSTPVDFSTVRPGQSYTELGYGEVKTGSLLLFSILPLGTNSRQERAYEHLLRSRHGNAVLNGQIQESWGWTPIGTVLRTKISGTVVETK